MKVVFSSGELLFERCDTCPHVDHHVKNQTKVSLVFYKPVATRNFFVFGFQVSPCPLRIM